MAQLSTQMDERLTKEAYFANEKAIMSYLKGLVRSCNFIVLAVVIITSLTQRISYSQSIEQGI